MAQNPSKRPPQDDDLDKALDAPTPPTSPAQPAAAPRTVPKYRVTAEKKLAIGGQLLTFHVGDILSAESYGTREMAQILDSGMSMELYEPPKR